MTSSDSPRAEARHKQSWGAQVAHGVARKAHLGNTNTPEAVARMVVEQAVAPTFDVTAGGWWLEPAVGIGNFYFALLDLVEARGGDPLAFARRFMACDIDEDALTVFKQRLTEKYGWDEACLASLPLYATSLASLSLPEGVTGFEGILTNPPYLAAKNWGRTVEERTAQRHAWEGALGEGRLDVRADLYIAFFQWCHDHLAPGGRSIFLCADGWLETGYGERLRQELLEGPCALTELLSFPWKALFRDDTCPVITVVTRTHTPEEHAAAHLCIKVNDGNPLQTPSVAVYDNPVAALVCTEDVLSLKDLAAWWGPTSRNRRQRLLLPSELYRVLEDATIPGRASLGAQCAVTSFGWSIAELRRAGLVGPASPTSAVPLLFQEQARVGRPVDYRQGRPLAYNQEALLPEALQEGAPQAGSALAAKVKASAKAGGVWLAQAIDRAPLLFVACPGEEEVALAGVSKYFHLQPKAHATLTPGDTSRLLAACLSATPSLLAWERHCKEGTRKTLRTDENGYAKEIRRADLEALPLPSFATWSPAASARVLKAYHAFSNCPTPRVDGWLQDASWLAMDEAIRVAMSIEEAVWLSWRKAALAAYWRRMRHVRHYGKALQAWRESIAALS